MMFFSNIYGMNVMGKIIHSPLIPSSPISHIVRSAAGGLEVSRSFFPMTLSLRLHGSVSTTFVVLDQSTQLTR